MSKSSAWYRLLLIKKNVPGYVSYPLLVEVSHIHTREAKRERGAGTTRWRDPHDEEEVVVG